MRVRQPGFYADLDPELAERLRSKVVSTVKTVMESAMRVEVTEFLAQLDGEKPYREHAKHDRRSSANHS